MNIQINRITLGYEDRGTGLPLVFLHAFPLSRRMWDSQLLYLSRRFRVVTIDLRGHGESDAPLWRYRLEESADDVNGLLDHLAIDRAVLIGLSMGGYLAFAFYRQYARRVKGLVLADTRAGADSAEGREGRFQMAQTAYKKGASAIAELMLPKLFVPATLAGKPEIVRQVRSIIEANEISGIAGDLMAMAERPDSSAMLPTISCPTLIIVGEEDVATPPAESRFMADKIPGARLAVIPAAGHLSNVEQPDVFNRVVEEFAAGLPIE